MTRKTDFFERWSWFKFNNLGLALGMNLKFYASVAKARKFWGLIPTFAEVGKKKLVGGGEAPPPSPILNRFKIFHNQYYLFSLLLFYIWRFLLDIVYIKKRFLNITCKNFTNITNFILNFTNFINPSLFLKFKFT